jgi:lipopolysaccharide export LptBFGC system permease protein LptF
VPTETQQLRSALKWTWAALITAVLFALIATWIGTGTPLGGIVSIAGGILFGVACYKTAPTVGRR